MALTDGGAAFIEHPFAAAHLFRRLNHLTALFPKIPDILGQALLLFLVLVVLKLFKIPLPFFLRRPLGIVPFKYPKLPVLQLPDGGADPV